MNVYAPNSKKEFRKLAFHFLSQYVSARRYATMAIDQGDNLLDIIKRYPESSCDYRPADLKGAFNEALPPRSWLYSSTVCYALACKLAGYQGIPALVTSPYDCPPTAGYSDYAANAILENYLSYTDELLTKFMRDMTLNMPDATVVNGFIGAIAQNVCEMFGYDDNGVFLEKHSGLYLGGRSRGMMTIPFYGIAAEFLSSMLASSYVNPFLTAKYLGSDKLITMLADLFEHDDPFVVKAYNYIDALALLTAYVSISRLGNYYLEEEVQWNV